MNDPQQRLEDILARCEEAKALVERGTTAYDNDPLLRHAAKSIITDVGEAAKNLEDLPERIPGIPWQQIARMRDRVTHRYFGVNYDVVWNTLTTDLPALDGAIRRHRAYKSPDHDT